MAKPWQSLSQELEQASEGEQLVFPFVGRMYDVSNAALFYAHNGRLDMAQEKLAGESSKVLSFTLRPVVHRRHILLYIWSIQDTF